MRKEIVHGFYINSTTQEFEPFTQYYIAVLSRNEFLSVAYHLKICVRDEYSKLYKSRLGYSILLGEPPKLRDRFFTYKDAWMFEKLVRYWKAEIHKEMSRRVPSARYINKCMNRLELVVSVHAILK